jgi:hypothetical protein
MWNRVLEKSTASSSVAAAPLWKYGARAASALSLRPVN